MITLAVAQMMYFFYLQTPFTHGEDGIQAVPRGQLFGLLDLVATRCAMYYIGAGDLHRRRSCSSTAIIHSPFGQVLKAIRENEPRAISLGYDADRYKLLAFVLSATLAGLAGATKAIVFQLASLTDVHWTMSGEVVLMTLLGGMGTIFGPVVGAFVIIALESYLAGFGEWVTIITGAIFVVCVLAFRRGIVGEIAAWWARRAADAVGRDVRARLRCRGRRPAGLVVDGACRDGLPNGRYELRRADGRLRVVGAFNHGRRTGSFIFWERRRRARRAHPVRRRRAQRHAGDVVRRRGEGRRARAPVRIDVAPWRARRSDANLVPRWTSPDGSRFRAGSARTGDRVVGCRHQADRPDVAAKSSSATRPRPTPTTRSSRPWFERICRIATSARGAWR